MTHTMMSKFKRILEDVGSVFTMEIKRIFTDSGVILIFFVAGLLYPVLYNVIYYRENILNVPVAVVDDANCEASRRFIYKANATPEVNVVYHCTNMIEAKKLMEQRKVNGIFYFPNDYGERLAHNEQAFLDVYCDMSSFLFYKSVFMGTNFTMLDEMKNIQIQRYAEQGITGEAAEQLVETIPYDDVKLFCPGGGFTSFLIPALLILVIHQTMFFGIGMLSGTAREENNELYYLPVRLRKNSVYRIIIGRALAYFVIYTFLISVDLVLVPRMFGIPHIGRMGDLYLFFLPFLLATIFFCMTASVFVRNRETGIVTMVFFSVILLFLSGFAWPESNMPAFWKYFSYIFPSTHGIQGYIRINSMGANLNSVRFEYNFLWILAGFYFLTATFSLRYVNYRNRKLAYRRMVSSRINRGRIAVRKAYLERKEKRNFIN